MLQYLKNIKLPVLAFLVMAAVWPVNSYAEWGVNITGANCNAAADPALDFMLTDANEKSCIGQGINMNDFRVKVKFNGSGEFVGVYTAACVVPAAAIMGVSLGVASIAAEVECAARAAESQEKTIAVGQTEGFLRAPGIFGSGDLIRVTMRIEGDKVCAYGATPLPVLLNFEPRRTSDFNQKYGVTSRNSLGRLPDNCVYMPEPLPVAKPPVPAFISQACVDYDTGASQFRWPTNDVDANGNRKTGNSRSFTGVVVQCVEETMNNLFFSKHGVDTQTVFQKTQSKLYAITQVLLVLYIITLGFKFLINGKSGFKQEEFVKICLTIALVFYFAVGSGFIDLFPSIISTVKNLSSIVMDAAVGSPGDKTVSDAALATAEADYRNKRNTYSTARMNWGRYTAEVIGFTAAEKERRKVLMNTAKSEMDRAKKTYESAKMDALSFGYNYCNFTPFAVANKYRYTETAPDGSERIVDKSYMKLWDAVDCRLAKYLGVGVNPEAPSTPQALLLAVGSVLDGPVGILVFCLLLVFLLFVVLITIRIVHIYIISYIALVLLTYISPLIIPLVLFQYSKSSFKKWFQQLIAYSVQPIMLFAFLGFMFAIMDHMIYGGNHEFYPADKNQLVTNPSLNDHTIIRTQDGEGTWKCRDGDTIGCMYERFRLSKWSVSVMGAEIIRIYHVDDHDRTDEFSFSEPEPESSGFGVLNPWRESAGNPTHDKSTTANHYALSQSEFNTLLVELIKLTLMCFVLYALLGQVELMSKTLTNIVGGGGVSISSMPAVGPVELLDKIGSPIAKGVAKGAVQIGKGAVDATAGELARSARRKELTSKE